jgi:hypothetical protein
VCTTYTLHCVVVHVSQYTDIPRYVKSINVQMGNSILRQGTESEICCYKLRKYYRVIEKNKHETCFWFQKGRVVGNIFLLVDTEQATGKERSAEVDRHYMTSYELQFIYLFFPLVHSHIYSPNFPSNCIIPSHSENNFHNGNGFIWHVCYLNTS